MPHFCFGTFFTLLCGNKKDWDKKKKPEVSNRVLYFALLDITDKQNNPRHYVEKAKYGAVPGYKNDVPSAAKTCKGDDHPIQRHGSRTKYVERFNDDHHAVLVDFLAFIETYLDEQQHVRLAMSILELVIKSDLPGDDVFYVGESAADCFTVREIADGKRDYNLPCLLAGAMFYIVDNDIPNGSMEGQATVENWRETYIDAPYCPSGDSLGEDFVIDLVCEIPAKKPLDNDKIPSIKADEPHSDDVITPVPVVMLYDKDGSQRKRAVITENTPLLIGRSISVCGLVIENDSKISTIHCAVRYDASKGVFLIIDMNSTNGTFLLDGTRLNGKSEYPLTPSSKFRIATTILSVGFADDEPETIDAVTAEIPSIPIRQKEPEAPCDTEYYNLFILGSYNPDEPFFGKNRFIVNPERALTGYASDDIKTLFGKLGKAEIAHIKRLPSIFTCESNLREYPNQEAYYGFVTDVKVRENGINVYYSKDGTIPHNALVDYAANLAIQKFEFTHTHWTIKKVDLLEELADAGICHLARVSKADRAHGLVDLTRGNEEDVIIFDKPAPEKGNIPTPTRPTPARLTPTETIPREAGEVVDSRYAIIELIGRGGAGNVYKARHIKMNRLVALKEYIAGIETLSTEISVLMKLRHPFLPQVYDVFNASGANWLSMELIDGSDLYNIVRSAGPVDGGDLLRYARQLCEVVDYLHGLSPAVIHGDIKPNNIIISEDNNIALIDFNLSGISDMIKLIKPIGITRGFSAPDLYPDKQTQGDDKMITVSQYVPFPASNDEPKTEFCEALLTPQSDIYSIGATLFYLATAIRPTYLLSDIISSANLDKKLKKIIECCTDNNPNKRYATVAEIAKDLNRVTNRGFVIQKQASRLQIESDENNKDSMVTMFIFN